jgi:alpha-N-arabinofuranosidase
LKWKPNVLRSHAIVDCDTVIAKTDPRLFGAFVEHLGRCIYGGLYEPGHPEANAQGFRQDVLALVKELKPSILRYPGGNFVSGYNWEDGVGPIEQRPRRLDLAWRSTETNTFGTNEFIDWCRAAGIEPMLAVNLGTRGADAARNMVEYCNHPGGTALSDLRREHGWDAPHDVKFWCLGNEMDGPWQMEAKTPTEYGRVATEAAKMMKWVDPGIELAACGSSARNMETFGLWEDVVLEHCFEHVEYISLHTYLNDFKAETEGFLASPDLMDSFIEEVVAIADAVAARKRSPKRIMLSFDEWNVWYRTRRQNRTTEGWPVAPPILEEIYTMKDALVFGGACIALLNHADRVKVACLAQLVNAIAPILTETGGPAWRQTIFYPFAHFSRLGRGRVLRAQIDSPTYATSYFDPRGDEEHRFALPAVPYLKLAVVHDEDTGGLNVFALNRSLDRELTLTLEARNLGALRVEEAVSMSDADLEAANTRRSPERIKPVALDAVSIRDGNLQATLKPASWNVVCLSPAGKA